MVILYEAYTILGLTLTEKKSEIVMTGVYVILSILL